MATASEVKAGLDDISQSIRTERQAAKAAVARLVAAYTKLGNLATTFSDVVTTIQAYPSDGSETPVQALQTQELADLTAEFQALRTNLNTINTAASAVDLEG